MAAADRLKQLFEVAVELPSAERDGFLGGACSDDDALRSRLLRLLQAHDEAGDFLEHPTGMVEAAANDPEAGVDDELVVGGHIDHFELLERLGHGGFGSVWRARQEEPVVRDVALKVLHAGGDAAEVAERFAAERQSLARMRHPGIAKVIDAGVTDSGRSWMAMELVEGEPLVRYCDAHGLGIDARLRLFIEVCRAVQHAHSKGVVHRDLKPSNVLVAERDGAAQPVVVDFGVARSRGESDVALPLGTPEYMSPEQTRADVGAVDTVTDVYALGVLLYELLGRCRPFTRPAGHDGTKELLQRIRVGGAAPLAELPTALPGLPIELDWVVAKAMAVEPAHRYEAAAALAEDVQRVRDHEAVTVAPAGRGYRLRKLARRHRLLVGAASAVLVASSLGTFFAVRGLLVARAAEQAAVIAEQRARDDQRAAERASERARRALDLLDNLWESADPARSGRADYPVRELLADFERTLPDRVEGDPEVEYRVRLSLARLQRIGGSLDKARVHADRIVELASETGEPLHLLTALVEQARARFDSGDIAAAVAAVTTGLGHVDEVATPQAAAALLEIKANCLQRRGEWQQAVAAAEHGQLLRQEAGDLTGQARSSLQLANLYGARGRVDEALEHLAQARRLFEPLGDKHPEALVALQHESLLLLRRGDMQAAEECLSECLEGRRELYGADHAEVAWTEVDLAWLFHVRGRDAEAEPLLRRAITVLRQRLGEHHVFVSEAMQRLGAVLVGTGASVEAEQLLRAAADNFRDLPGHAVEGRVGCLGNLAGLLWKRGRQQQAIELQAEALAIARERLPEDHFVTSTAMTNLAFMQSGVGRREEAVALLAEALQRSSSAGRKGEAETQRERLVALLRQLGRTQEATAIEQGRPSDK
ncbi:MAG: tetratricopeptide repeat protein [Planctomycetes bacterium]|nr:tetratricopeptide repeat protein [Planctomycetota bacterium]